MVAMVKVYDIERFFVDYHEEESLEKRVKSPLAFTRTLNELERSLPNVEVKVSWEKMCSSEA